jgi:triacylglycerol esterase/lipase EstA (alpha/beta hydrolase family)
MGGLVARYYVQRLGGIERVRRLITISSPHNGTCAAFLRRNGGARQMRPGSAFLCDLNRDVSVLDRIDFTSIWTPFDLMILPAHSSVLPAGRAIRVNVGAHPPMVRNQRVLKLVADVLSTENLARRNGSRGQKPLNLRFTVRGCNASGLKTTLLSGVSGMCDLLRKQLDQGTCNCF